MCIIFTTAEWHIPAQHGFYELEKMMLTVITWYIVYCLPMAANNILIVSAASVGLATEVTNLYSESLLWWVSFVSYLTFLSLG